MPFELNPDSTVTYLPCPRCGNLPTAEGHDWCLASRLGALPGVDFACCGHGIQRGYISFTNGLVIRGQFELIEDWSSGHPALIHRGLVK